MLLALGLSSLVSGLIATTVMLVFLYLPLLWGGLYYDTVGALGTLVTGQERRESRFLGTVALFVGGVIVALFYGWATIFFMQGNFLAPEYTVLHGWPVTLNLFYPLAGMIMGFGQGIFVSLITAFVMSDVHPVESYRQPFPLLVSYIVGHTVYGVTVMFFHSQLLELFLS